METLITVLGIVVIIYAVVFLGMIALSMYAGKKFDERLEEIAQGKK